MTHEELLDFCENQIQTYAVEALRAVIEFHSPIEIPNVYMDGEITLQQGLACHLCSDEMYQPYPCATIQAIEQQLPNSTES